MKFEEIKSNSEILAKLRWDLTPQNSSGPYGGTWEISSQADFDKFKVFLKTVEGYYFYVDVWNCQARLGLAENNSQGGGKMEIISDFESPLLEKAVYQVGGSITTSGWYPLSKSLATLLQRKLGVKEQ